MVVRTRHRVAIRPEWLGQQRTAVLHVSNDECPGRRRAPPDHCPPRILRRPGLHLVPADHPGPFCSDGRPVRDAGSPPARPGTLAGLLDAARDLLLWWLGRLRRDRHHGGSGPGSGQGGHHDPLRRQLAEQRIPRGHTDAAAGGVDRRFPHLCGRVGRVADPATPLVHRRSPGLADVRLVKQWRGLSRPVRQAVQSDAQPGRGGQLCRRPGWKHALSSHDEG